MKKNTRLLNMIFLIATIVLAVVALATIALNLTDMSLEVHGGAKGDLVDVHQSIHQTSFAGFELVFGATKSTPSYGPLSVSGAIFALVPYILLVLGIVCAVLGFCVKKLNNRLWVGLTASILALAAGFFLVILPSVRFDAVSTDNIEVWRKFYFDGYVAQGYHSEINVSYNLAPTLFLYIGLGASLASALVATARLAVFNIEDKQAKEEAAE